MCSSTDKVVVVVLSKIGLGLEVLVAELLAGESEFPDVLQAVRVHLLQAVHHRLLHVPILRSNQLEQVRHNLEVQILKLKGFFHNFSFAQISYTGL